MSRAVPRRALWGIAGLVLGIVAIVLLATVGGTDEVISGSTPRDARTSSAVGPAATGIPAESVLDGRPAQFSARGDTVVVFTEAIGRQGSERASAGFVSRDGARTFRPLDGFPTDLDGGVVTVAGNEVLVVGSTCGPTGADENTFCGTGEAMAVSVPLDDGAARSLAPPPEGTAVGVLDRDPSEISVVLHLPSGELHLAALSSQDQWSTIVTPVGARAVCQDTDGTIRAITSDRPPLGQVPPPVDVAVAMPVPTTPASPPLLAVHELADHGWTERSRFSPEVEVPAEDPGVVCTPTGGFLVVQHSQLIHYSSAANDWQAPGPHSGPDLMSPVLWLDDRTVVVDADTGTFRATLTDHVPPRIDADRSLDGLQPLGTTSQATAGSLALFADDDGSIRLAR
jgi:hypothetical protein